MARTLGLDTVVSADFSFTLNNATPQPRSPQIIAGPGEPQSEWDKTNWDSILNGYDLTRNTYTTLPQFVTAQLQCKSYHLNAGGNTRAAWWMNMAQK